MNDPLSSASPLLQQYFEIKKNYSHAFVFFQVGDFYELFFDDAVKASQILNITLTKKGHYEGKDIPLCGVPVHTAATYYLRLVREGHTAVICSQVEQAQPGKLVKRSVTQVITPSTITDENGLNALEPSYMCFIEKQKQAYRVGRLELLTQSVLLLQLNDESGLLSFIEKWKPKELFVVGAAETLFLMLQNHEYNAQNISSHITTGSWIESKNIPHDFHALCFHIHAYLLSHHNADISSYTFLVKDAKEYMVLDSATQRHLELLYNTSDNTTQHTLFDVLHHTKTAMGSRLLRLWIVNPLRSLTEIKKRQEAVSELLHHWHYVDVLWNGIKVCGDLERSLGRARLEKATYTDFQKIARSLHALKECKEYSSLFSRSDYLDELTSQISNFDDLASLCDTYLYQENRPGDLRIRPESDDHLMQLQKCITSSSQVLLLYEQEEQQKTGITSLKIRSTPLYGYVLEINKTNISAIPSSYIRVQTLTTKERYTTPELKKLEYEIVNAQDSYTSRENELFHTVTQEIYKKSSELLKAAHSIATYDVLLAFAHTARLYNYVCPEVTEKNDIFFIQNGRHPLLVKQLRHACVSNTLSFDAHTKTWVITGPNMGGKSTFMRQCALHCILAQIGSFIPAEKATVPLLDAVFTRIGAADYLTKGKSTFAVEMEETAHICSNADEKSLVILDEIGRGTSTYDGMSLAYAIIKYLHTNKRPFLLCATHYHELFSLFHNDKSIGWHHAAVARNADGSLVLLYRIKEGHESSSLGIEIAAKLGLPDSVISWAYETKALLEKL